MMIQISGNEVKENETNEPRECDLQHVAIVYIFAYIGTSMCLLIGFDYKIRTESLRMISSLSVVFYHILSCLLYMFMCMIRQSSGGINEYVCINKFIIANTFFGLFCLLCACFQNYFTIDYSIMIILLCLNVVLTLIGRRIWIKEYDLVAE